MIIESFLVGPIQTNIYLIGCEATGAGAIVDAGGSPDDLLARADDHDLTIQGIWQTHAHIDHVAALSEVKQRTDAPIYLHPDDQPMYDAAPRQGQMFGIECDPLPQVDHYIEDGDTMTLGNLEAEIIHLPGHSPGGIAFYFADTDDGGVLLSGDILFENSIGRVDLPGADPDAMKSSLERLMELPDDVRVLPGHGAETTIGREREHNPYINRSW
jgi:glyoxylase-like metal-dependent hydrolase (beta-lactamase superfamily II)